MSKIVNFSNADFSIECIMVDDMPWFKGKEVATILGYANTKNAIINNVREQDKRKMEEIGGPSQVSTIWSSAARRTKPRNSEDGSQLRCCRRYAKRVSTASWTYPSSSRSRSTARPTCTEK